MRNLSDLSTELLLAIISDLPSAVLLSLLLTNRRLHKIAITKMYESIYFWGTGNKVRTERVFGEGEYGELYDTQKAPIHASRIFDLGAFTIFLQRHPRLASRIRNVELCWDAGDGMEDEKRVLLFLDAAKCLQLRTLVLTPPSLFFQVPAHAAVTTLRTRHKGHYGGRDEDVVPDIDQFYKQCCISSLQEISINGWLYWSRSVTDANLLTFRGATGPGSDASLLRANTSPITVLRMSTLGAPIYVFNEILSWPKRLQSFHFECHPYCGWGQQYQMPGKLSSEDFIKPLQQCRNALEELSIRCFVGHKFGAPRTSRQINLRAFSNLKRLCIRHDFLLMARSWRELYLSNNRRPPQLPEVLPPSLEQLHLEIGDNGFPMYADDANTIVSDDVYWLLDTLEQLAHQKADYLPFLTKVVSGESRTFDNDYRFWDIINGCERGAQVKAAFARENIRFSCWVTDDAPRVFDD